MAKYYATFPNELGIIVSHDTRQKDELDLILLEFRKLREGIISSSRSDDFAVEVYETSAKLALLGRNIPQIASILPHLVKTLHQPSKSAKKNTSKDLETGLERLALNEKQDISLDTRARFLSYYMLHLICHMEDAKAFQQLLQDSVSFGLDLSDSNKISYSNKHVKFAVQILHCFLHNNYAALSKITFNPRSYDKFAWIIVRSAQDAFRARAWKALKTSYMLVEDRLWLARQLQLDGDEQLSAFLKRENWEGKTDEKGALLLKKG